MPRVRYTFFISSCTCVEFLLWNKIKLHFSQKSTQRKGKEMFRRNNFELIKLGNSSKNKQRQINHAKFILKQSKMLVRVKSINVTGSCQYAQMTVEKKP